MAEPVIFISRNRIKEGKAEDFRMHYRESLPRTNAEKPGTLVQLSYENEDATEVTVIRLFPDADAFDRQLQGASDRSRMTYEFIEPVSIEIFGNPNPSTLERITQIAGSSIIVRISPTSLGGFIR